MLEGEGLTWQTIDKLAWLAHADWAKTSAVDHLIFDGLKARGELR